MKPLYYLLLLTLYSSSSCEDIEEVTPTLPEEQSTTLDEEIAPSCWFLINEEMPKFPGGHLRLMEFIRDNLQWNEPRLCVSGRVFVSFTVNKDGSVSNPEVLRGICDSFDQAALAVIQKLPDFIPARDFYGQPIKVRMMVPVYFHFGE